MSIQLNVEARKVAAKGMYCACSDMFEAGSRSTPRDGLPNSSDYLVSPAHADGFTEVSLYAGRKLESYSTKTTTRGILARTHETISHTNFGSLHLVLLKSASRSTSLQGRRPKVHAFYPVDKAAGLCILRAN